jgi:hypothetical protein
LIHDTKVVANDVPLVVAVTCIPERPQVGEKRPTGLRGDGGRVVLSVGRVPCALPLVPMVTVFTSWVETPWRNLVKFRVTEGVGAVAGRKKNNKRTTLLRSARASEPRGRWRGRCRDAPVVGRPRRHALSPRAQRPTTGGTSLGHNVTGRVSSGSDPAKRLVRVLKRVPTLDLATHRLAITTASSPEIKTPSKVPAPPMEASGAVSSLIRGRSSSRHDGRFGYWPLERGFFPAP